MPDATTLGAVACPCILSASRFIRAALLRLQVKSSLLTFEPGDFPYAVTDHFSSVVDGYEVQMRRSSFVIELFEPIYLAFVEVPRGRHVLWGLKCRLLGLAVAGASSTLCDRSYTTFDHSLHRSPR